MLDKCLVILLLGCVSVGVSGCEGIRDAYKETVVVADGKFKVYKTRDNGKKELVFTAPIKATLRKHDNSESSWCVISNEGSSWMTPLPCEHLDNLVRCYTEDKAGGNPFKNELIRESIAYEKAEKARLDKNG